MFTFLKYLSAGILWFIVSMTIVVLCLAGHLPPFLRFGLGMAFNLWFMFDGYSRYDSWFNRTFGQHRS